LQRQVRIEGTIARIASDESDAYFAQRPRGHRLSAWASPQSQVVDGRGALERRMREEDARFGESEVTRPPFWGGYRLEPATIEFWQGRPDRVHDRLLYTSANGAWSIVRLAP